MEIKKILIVGPGQMGSGIAHVMAQAGIEVSLRSYSLASVQRGMAYIEKNINKAIEKGKMTKEEKEGILSRINIAGEVSPEDYDVDMAIEAVPEKMDMKLELFKKFDKFCPPRTIIATNTSSLPVTALGAATSRPEKVVGVHFFSPVHLMKLVEIVNSMVTSQETNDDVTRLISKCADKSPVKVTDYPGFVGNRIMVPMMNEAIYALFEGVAEPKTIDDVIVLGFNHPIGPLRLCDAIGNDTILSVMEVLYKEFGDPKFRPCPLLRKMVEANYLGKKSGRGFYNDYKK